MDEDCVCTFLHAGAKEQTQGHGAIFKVRAKVKFIVRVRVRIRIRVSAYCGYDVSIACVHVEHYQLQISKCFFIHLQSLIWLTCHARHVKN